MNASGVAHPACNGRITVIETIKPQGRSRQRSSTLSVQSLRLQQQQSRAIATRGSSQRLACNERLWLAHHRSVTTIAIAAISCPRCHNVRTTAIESIEPQGRPSPSFACIEPLSHDVMRSCSLTVTNQQTSGRRYPWVIPTVLTSIERTLSPHWG